MEKIKEWWKKWGKLVLFCGVAMSILAVCISLIVIEQAEKEKTAAEKCYVIDIAVPNQLIFVEALQYPNTKKKDVSIISCLIEATREISKGYDIKSAASIEDDESSTSGTNALLLVVEPKKK
jgi:hypothetical protein